MKAQITNDEWIVLEENDPPPDLTRENAAYERERERLVRDHLGKIALIRDDEVVGVFDNVDDAVREGCRRFGWARMIFREITASDGPEYIANVDINHPSFKRLDEAPVTDHGQIPHPG